MAGAFPRRPPSRPWIPLRPVAAASSKATPARRPDQQQARPESAGRRTLALSLGAFNDLTCDSSASSSKAKRLITEINQLLADDRTAKAAFYNEIKTRHWLADRGLELTFDVNTNTIALSAWGDSMEAHEVGDSEGPSSPTPSTFVPLGKIEEEFKEAEAAAARAESQRRSAEDVAFSAQRPRPPALPASPASPASPDSPAPAAQAAPPAEEAALAEVADTVGRDQAGEISRWSSQGYDYNDRDPWEATAMSAIPSKAPSKAFVSSRAASDGGVERGLYPKAASTIQSRGQPAAAAPKPSAPTPEMATAFAVLPTESGPSLAPEKAVPKMLMLDWALFLELACYSGELQRGCPPVAYGIEEVAEACMQEAVAVLFISVDCGHGGERAVKETAQLGGRGYILGSNHELHEDLAQWGSAVAILRRTLSSVGGAEPAPKRFKALGIAPFAGVRKERVPADAEGRQAGGDGMKESALKEEGQPCQAQSTAGLAQADEAEDPQAQAHEGDLKSALKSMGKLESLKDKKAIPRMSRDIRRRYFKVLSPTVIFKQFGDVFNTSRNVAHRKALIYVTHELLVGKNGNVMSCEDRRVPFVQQFLLRIGERVRNFKADERDAYVKLLGAWAHASLLQKAEVAKLKDTWDMSNI